VNTCSKPLAGAALLFVLQAGIAEAQDGSRGSLLVAPFASSAAPNMASQVTGDVRRGVGSLGLFDQVDWAALLDSSLVTREMTEEERAELTCINARQLAVREGIDSVLCGGIAPTPDGVLLELQVFRSSAGEGVRLEPVVAKDQKSLVVHTLEQLRAWGRERGEG
jgi:hypothetical protein